MTRALSRAAALLALALALARGTRRPAPTGYLDDWHPYQTYWGVGWSAAVPVTSLRSSYIDNTGWLGGGFDVRIGVAGRLARRRERHLELVRPDLLRASPWSSRTSPSPARSTGASAPSPLLGTAHYYLTSGAVQPFVGVGAGWHLDLDPAAGREPAQGATRAASPWRARLGILFTVAERLGLYLSGRYQFNLTTHPRRGRTRSGSPARPASPTTSDGVRPVSGSCRRPGPGCFPGRR